MSNTRNLLATLMVLGLASLEIFLLKQNNTNACGIAWLSAGLPVVLLSLAYSLNKTTLIFVTFFNAFKAGLASLLGLVLILYTALHIGWMGSYINDYIEKGEHLAKAFTVIGFFCTPFFIIPFFYARKKPGISLPEVLISNLSYNDTAKISQYIQNNVLPWNWEPTIEILNTHKSINKIYLLVSETAGAQFKGLSYQGVSDVEIYRQMLREKGLGHVQLFFRNIIDPNDLFDYKRDAEKQLADVLDESKYPDEKLVFDITGSTVFSSIAMVLLAFKGKRMAVYKQQSGPKGVPLFNPDTQSIRELWQQILESL